MNRGTRFAKKTVIYAIGNFGSRILTFLMVPYYTHNISTTDYGTYDIILVTISLIMPVLTLQTQEAIIAGMVDKDKDYCNIIKCTFSIVIFNSFVVTILYFLISKFISIQYGLYFIILLVIKSIYTIIQQYARGLSKSELYAFVGIIYTFIFLGLNIINISVLHTGIPGLLISEAIASLLSSVIILIGAPNIIFALKVKIDRYELKRIIKYSMPLIPNNISWWLINASDRYVIAWFLGNASNGVYAISYKFANIIQTVTSLIYLAWQEVSLEEYNSKDKDVFYSKFFNSYMKLLMSGVLIAICCTKFVTVTFIENSYSSAWRYAGWLYMGVVFSALASFLNTCYLANGKTNEILKGTLLAGIINLIVNITLINFIGIYAASLSTAISSFVLLMRRIFDNKRYYNLEIEWKSFTILCLMCVVVSLAILMSERYIIDICMLIVALIVAFVFNRNLLMLILKKLIQKKG